ncbi:hypothetical protein HYALB_00011607 [Hymenoscyphus albidus]|uniref:LOV domain-containing protein n=1 Tax=Hymenoscyphus albidus TaxID=595503 RepID=A0A9N9Q930_9HELO|nr:hypothetical protein HYALB_00011607 [Hymenoscyphus albidus]
MPRYPPSSNASAVSIDPVVPTETTVNMLLEPFSGRSNSPSTHKAPPPTYHSDVEDIEALTPTRSRHQSMSRYTEQSFENQRRTEHSTRPSNDSLPRKMSFGEDLGNGRATTKQRHIPTPVSPLKEMYSRGGGSKPQPRHIQPGLTQHGHSNVADFYSPEVFQVVLNNPTTAHRLKRFCQSRACGEDMEYLQKITEYNRLLDDMAQLLGSINSQYLLPDAPRSVTLPRTLTKQVSSDIRYFIQNTIPSLESVFAGSQETVEKILVEDMYPRFVRHQVTTSATLAMSDHKEKFQGLGDCFCITDPSIADNPILWASDGFVSVTGYERKDIIPRNCRFLQGSQTDTKTTKRLKLSIQNCEESVELLLNYRKNGDPFWNLLYVSPLFNEQGEVTYFLGGQINCSTTIHSFTDVLRVLSANDDELEKFDLMDRPVSVRSREPVVKSKSSFFKAWRKYSVRDRDAGRGGKVVVRGEAGMEGELVGKLERLNFDTQVEAFYTAYSKYLVMDLNAVTQTLTIQHYSPGVIDMLCLNLPNGNVIPIYNKDIFKVLADYTASPTSHFRDRVKENMRRGGAVSLEIGFLTGYAEKKGGGLASGKSWFRGTSRDALGGRTEERYVTHWTPLKDVGGRTKRVVLTIAPK